MNQYFIANNQDLSAFVSGIKVVRRHKYYSQESANGNLFIDDVKNPKRTIEVSFISVENKDLQKIASQLNKLNVQIQFLDPNTQKLESATCIVPQTEIELYTVYGAENARYKAFNVQFIEI